MKESNPFENPEVARKYIAMDESHYVKRYSIYPTVLGLLGDIYGKTIIDMGCGDGGFSRMLVEKGARVNAFDSSEEMLRIAERKTAEKMGSDYYERINFWKNKAERLSWQQMGAGGAVALFFFNYVRTRKDLRAVCKRVYNNLSKGARFIAFQNQFEDAHFMSGRVGNVTYTQEGCNETGQLLWGLEREDKEGRAIKLNLTDWTQFNYEAALKEAGFRNITWHSPIVSQEGMDALGKDFWADYIKAGLFRGFEARK